MEDNTIISLAKVFSEKGIYSKNRYLSNECPLNVFRNLFPDDSHTRQIESFLSYQPESNEGEGADLPWWGNYYFSDKKGTRIMILSQDSRTPNGGSVTFYMPLIKMESTIEDLRSIINSHPTWDKFVSFNKTKQFLDRCQFDYDFVYVTDAKKISNGWEKLLEDEIEIVNPDIILCLGNTGLSHLLQMKKAPITNIVDREDTSVMVHTNVLSKMKRKPIVVASLFPSNANAHFTNHRVENVVNTLHKEMDKMEAIKL